MRSISCGKKSVASVGVILILYRQTQIQRIKTIKWTWPELCLFDPLSAICYAKILSSIKMIMFFSQVFTTNRTFVCMYNIYFNYFYFNFRLLIIPALMPVISPEYAFCGGLKSLTWPFLRILALRNLVRCLTRGLRSSFFFRFFFGISPLFFSICHRTLKYVTMLHLGD